MPDPSSRSEFVDLYLTRTKLLSCCGKATEAWAALDLAKHMLPDSQRLYRTGCTEAYLLVQEEDKRDGVLGHLTAVLSSVGTDDTSALAEALETQAAVCTTLGRIEDGLDAIQRALSLNELEVAVGARGVALLFRQQGRLLSLTGHHREALAAFQQAVACIVRWQSEQPPQHEARSGHPDTWSLSLALLELCISTAEVAYTQQALGQWDAALASYNHLVHICSQTEMLSEKVLLALLKVRGGQFVALCWTVTVE